MPTLVIEDVPADLCEEIDSVPVSRDVPVSAEVLRQLREALCAARAAGVSVRLAPIIPIDQQVPSTLASINLPRPAGGSVIKVKFDAERLPTRVDVDALEAEFGPPYLTTIVNLPDPSPGKPVTPRKAGALPFELCCELEEGLDDLPNAPQG